MNNLKHSVLFLACAAALITGTRAEEKGEPPAPPFIAPLPDRFCWTVTYKRAKPNPPGETPARTRKELAVTKTGVYQREVLTWSDGTKEVGYFVRGSELLQDLKTKSVEVIPGGLGSHDFFAAGFVDAAWVGIDSFVDSATVTGRLCHHYRGAGRALPDQRSFPSGQGRPSPAPVAPAESEAWIDQETRFPLLVKTEAEIIEYRYPPVPKEDVVLPDEFAAAWNKYQYGLQLMEKMRMR